MPTRGERARRDVPRATGVDFVTPRTQLLAPETTWNFQAWYRDPAGGGGSVQPDDAFELTFEP